MDFVHYMNNHIDEMDTVYDLAALCYEYIMSVVSDNEPIFLGTYIYENEKSGENNPNLKKLHRFSGTVEGILRKQDKEGVQCKDCINDLGVVIQKVLKTLKPYCDTEKNELTIPYFILMAIDRYVATKKCLEVEPLNKSYMNNTYIYWESGNYILKKSAENNDFPDIISDCSIKSDFTHLIFLKKEICEGKDAPKIRALYIDKEDTIRQEIIKQEQLKIAVIPFGEYDMVKFPQKRGGVFYVEYEDEHIRNGVLRAEKLLEKAIDKKANIIIFPEFVCSAQIQEAIQKKLEEMYKKQPERIQNLLLVVAGTRWSEDNNNICYLYAYDGRCLGRQYKTVPYSDTKNPDEIFLEGLENPGKEITLMDIEGIGKILIGICKDISMGAYIKQLADIFSPQFLLIPAWSKSVKIGFSEQLKEISVKNHKTCCILCNCCEAMNRLPFKEVIGLVTTPYKEKTAIIGNERKIERKEEICRECRAKGCIFMVTLDFSPQNVCNGKIVKRMEQKSAM